jgi:hypothetical protein
VGDPTGSYTRPRDLLISDTSSPRCHLAVSSAGPAEGPGRRALGPSSELSSACRTSYAVPRRVPALGAEHLASSRNNTAPAVSDHRPYTLDYRRHQVEVTTWSRLRGSCCPLVGGAGYVARAIANPRCVSIYLPPKVKMTRSEISPAFDPALQPIGHALASELLAEGMSIEVPPATTVPVALSARPDLLSAPPDLLSAPPDLFGWELPHVAA